MPTIEDHLKDDISYYTVFRNTSIWDRDWANKKKTHRCEEIPAFIFSTAAIEYFITLELWVSFDSN